ncbi:MAG TPA: cytochrome c [Nannocystaceae bacterium]|nr:cytochrome c [Nannocystaceae bacterium]
MPALPLRISIATALAFVVACNETVGPERDIDGQVLYEQYCARCHGLDGRPVPEQPQARNLADRRIVDSLSDQAIEMMVKNGREPSMPAFRDQFTEASLMVLIAYVRSLSGSQGSHTRPEERAP